MKGGKGKSKDASQWEPDDDLQAVSDIQDQHVCVRTSCVRWTSIVTSLIGVGKILARKEHQICFAPMLTGSTVWTFHLQYEGWKGQKQRCIAMGARWWLAGRFGYSRSTCMCSHLLRALNINSCFSNWWWKNCSKKRASNLLCTHADRIYSLDLPSSIWRVERAKAKMHRNGCKGALDRCFSVVSLRKVNFLKVARLPRHYMSKEFTVLMMLNLYCHNQTMRSLKDISILTGSTRLYTWFQRWKGQEQRCITTRAWRHVRGGSVYFGLCTLSVKTSPSFCYRYFTLHRYPTCPQTVTFERNYVFSDYHFWYPCENSNV